MLKRIIRELINRIQFSDATFHEITLPSGLHIKMVELDPCVSLEYRRIIRHPRTRKDRMHAFRASLENDDE